MDGDKNLQVENGNFTRIVNPLIENLIKIPFKGCELAVAIFIIRKTYGFNKKQDEISLTQFEEGLGRSRQTIVNSLKNLQLVNMVRLVKKGSSKKSSNIWEFNKYYHTWKLVNMVRLVKRKGSTSLTEASQLVYPPRHTKDNTKNNTKDIAPKTARVKRGENEKITDWNMYLNAMDEHNARHVNIIAHYFREKGIYFETYGKVNSAIRRHLRSAKELSPFSDEEITNATKQAKKEYPDLWTIETLIKILTR